MTKTTTREYGRTTVRYESKTGLYAEATKDGVTVRGVRGDCYDTPEDITIDPETRIRITTLRHACRIARRVVEDNEAQEVRA